MLTQSYRTTPGQLPLLINEDNDNARKRAQGNGRTSRIQTRPTSLKNGFSLRKNFNPICPKKRKSSFIPVNTKEAAENRKCHTILQNKTISSRFFNYVLLRLTFGVQSKWNLQLQANYRKMTYHWLCLGSLYNLSFSHINLNKNLLKTGQYQYFKSIYWCTLDYYNCNQAIKYVYYLQAVSSNFISHLIVSILCIHIHLLYRCNDYFNKIFKLFLPLSTEFVLTILIIT